MTEGILPWVLGVCAALIIGLTKTGVPGIGILAVALMVMVFPAKQSVGAVLPMLIVGDLFAIAYYRRHAQWKRLFELFPCVIAGIAVGTFVLARMEGSCFKPFLGGLILVLLAVELLRQRLGWSNVPHKLWFVVLMGSLAGFATTVGNAAGPIMNIYLISKGLTKDKFMGTIAWYFFIFNCIKIPIYLSLGMINSETLRFNVFMIPMIVLGAVTGRWLLKRISSDLFKKIVLVVAAIAALWILIW